MNKVYDEGTTALDGLNLVVEKGEFVFLVGESGAGKTTLLKLLIGMEKPTTGNLIINGLAMEKAAPGEIRKLRRLTGMVFQDFKLIKGRTAEENVSLSLQVLGFNKRGQTLAEVSRDALEKVGLAHKRNQFVETLSWGERQRVAFARALVRQPDIFIADEPTGNLDEKNTSYIGQLLEDINAAGTTVVVATHDLNMVTQLKKRIITLEKGRLVSDVRP